MARRRALAPLDLSAVPSWVRECVLAEAEDPVAGWYHGWLFAVIAWWEEQGIDAADAPLDGRWRTAAPGERVPGWEEIGGASRPPAFTARPVVASLSTPDRDSWLTGYGARLRGQRR